MDDTTDRFLRALDAFGSALSPHMQRDRGDVCLWCRGTGEVAATEWPPRLSMGGGKSGLEMCPACCGTGKSKETRRESEESEQQ